MWKTFRIFVRGTSLIEWLIGVAIVGIALAVLFGVKDNYNEEKRWSKFAAEHHCVKVGEKAAQTVLTTNGVGTVDAQVGWKCDDGVTYWR